MAKFPEERFNTDAVDPLLLRVTVLFPWGPPLEIVNAAFKEEGRPAPVTWFEEPL